MTTVKRQRRLRGSSWAPGIVRRTCRKSTERERYHWTDKPGKAVDPDLDTSLKRFGSYFFLSPEFLSRHSTPPC